jgi:hypothetical protein
MLPLEKMTMAKKKVDATMKMLPAVPEAVQECGVEASLKEVRQWVKDKYGLDLTDMSGQGTTSVSKQQKS